MTELNVDLLLKTLDHIELLEALRAEGAQLEQIWDQASYRREHVVLGQEGIESCGTALCFAGWAAQLAGGHWCNDLGESLLVAENGWPTEHASDRSSRVLGITYDEAGALYAGGNDLRTLRTLVRALADGVRGQALRRLWVRELDRQADEALAT